MQKNKIKDVSLDVGVDLNADEFSDEEIYEYVLDIKKFKKWFNCFPLIWITCDDSMLRLGTVIKMHGGVPPFSFVFNATIKELKDCYLRAEIKGKFYGETEIYVEKLKDIVHFQKNFTVCADTQKELDAYAIGAKKFHGKYVKWRIECLKKIIRKKKLKEVRIKINEEGNVF